MLRLQDSKVFYPTVSSRDPSALFQKSSNPDDGNIPSFSYLSYVRSDDVAEVIGANTTYDQCNQDVKDDFGDSGEAGLSFLKPLGKLADDGMPMLIWVSGGSSPSLSPPSSRTCELTVYF